MDTINGRYRLVGFLDEGGMTQVYQGRDLRRDGKPVALKFVPSEKLTVRRIQFLQNEYRLLARLTHPNLEDVYRFGHVREGPDHLQNTFFFSAEYLSGIHLMEATAGKSPREICRYLVPVCRVLHYLHTNNLVHHDVKPQNIVLCQPPPESDKAHTEDSADVEKGNWGNSSFSGDQIKLVDLDLAEPLDQDRDLTVRGTTPYIAPELFSGAPADNRSDLYSLGMTFFVLLNRNIPFPDDTDQPPPEEKQHLARVHLEDKSPSVPKSLQELVFRLLDPEPDERPDSARTVIRALSSVTQHHVPLETPSTVRGYIGSTMHVGREEEMENIKQAWRQIRSRQNSFVAVPVLGEEGIGKDRLVSEFSTWAMTENQVLIHHPLQSERTESERLRSLFKRLLRTLEQTDPGRETEKDPMTPLENIVQTYLNFEGEQPITPETDALPDRGKRLKELFEPGLKSTLDHCLILILEDLQDACSPSLTAITELCSLFEGEWLDARMLLLFTGCPSTFSDPEQAFLNRIRNEHEILDASPDPLSPGEVEKYVESMFGNADERFLQKLSTLNEKGNPNQIEQRITELVDTGILYPSEDGWMLDSEKFWKFKKEDETVMNNSQDAKPDEFEGDTDERSSRIPDASTGPAQDENRPRKTPTDVPGRSEQETGEDDVRTRYGRIMGQSEPMQNVYRTLDHVTSAELNIVIEGETGTGKELVAREIHDRGLRSDGPFVAVNCARFSESLLESELFGYVAGAFTGAEGDHEGLIEQADGGTLFLDEIGEMSTGMQGKLLRVMETDRVRRLGAEEVKEVDVRFIGATNRPLKTLMDQDKFRDDLYYRLRDASVYLPPLEERREDIPMLVDHFLEEIAREKNEPKKRVDHETLLFLMNESWPGNVRQLRSKVRQMVIFSGDRQELRPSDMQDSSRFDKKQSEETTKKSPVQSSHRKSTKQQQTDPTPDPDDVRALEDLEKAEIKKALLVTDGNKKEAAELLGIHRSTLYRKMKEYDLSS